MKKLRIAQVVSLQESVPPKGKNGLESMVYYLTEELVKRGHDVTLFATTDSKTSAKLVDVLPFPYTKKRLFGWSATDYSLFSIAKAAEMANQFDIIHSHLGSPAYYFANLIKTPMIETIHSEVTTNIRNDIKKDTHKRYRLDFRKRSEKVYRVFISNAQWQNARNKKNSTVIHNGICLDEFQFQEKPKDHFAFLGYINPEKGAHIAVQIAKKLKIKLKIAGSYMGCEDYFEKKIKPYLEKGKIDYMGVVNSFQRNKFLGFAKAILAPICWEEPFGLVMIESMACGTPVIAFKRGSIPEIVENGKTGFIVENEKEMIEAIKNIDKINRDECRKHAEGHFIVERMVDEYERVYNKIIKEKTLSPR